MGLNNLTPLENAWEVLREHGWFVHHRVVPRALEEGALTSDDRQAVEVLRAHLQNAREVPRGVNPLNDMLAIRAERAARDVALVDWALDRADENR